MAQTPYAAAFRDDGEGGLWAELPDLPGCYGYGDTAVECAESASNALETHLAAMEEDDIGPPKCDRTPRDGRHGRMALRRHIQGEDRCDLDDSRRGGTRARRHTRAREPAHSRR